jgi:hypothetical protein
LQVNQCPVVEVDREPGAAVDKRAHENSFPKLIRK